MIHYLKYKSNDKYLKIGIENTIKQGYNLKKSESKKTYTFEEVEIFIKAFHLDVVEGRYSKELLSWCNDWIYKNFQI